MNMPLLKSRVICIYQNGDLNISSIMVLHLSSFLYHSFFITVQGTICSMFNVAAALCVVPCFITLHQTMVRIICFEVSSLMPLQVVCRPLVPCPHQNITNPKTGHHSLYSAVHHVLYGRSCCAKFFTIFNSLQLAMADHGRASSTAHYFTMIRICNASLSLESPRSGKQAMRIIQYGSTIYKDHEGLGILA